MLIQHQKKSFVKEKELIADKVHLKPDISQAASWPQNGVAHYLMSATKI
jgi:hypothetical protein